VVGLGYVGLPLLLTAARAGLGAVGYDVSGERVALLREGRSHVDDVSDEDLKWVLGEDVEFSDDPAILARADAVFVCVPSPLGRNRQPDLSYIESAARTVADHLRPGQLFVLESTSYPGTTEDYLVKVVEERGLRIDDDVWVAFSSERVSPGDEMKTGDIPKVVGGVTPFSGQVAAAAYQRLVPRVHLVSSARAAEMSKLLENTYRAVNIGLINEMAQLAHELDIDIWEVIDAAATKPFGFQAFYPGPGVGGHCIPLDPQYLAWRAREANFATRFIETAEQVNAKMPSYNASRIAEILNDRGIAVKGSHILGVGIAYKPNIADDRESAAIDVLRELQGRGARVSVLDPVVGDARISERGFEPVSVDAELTGFDLVAILTDHGGIDYARLAAQLPVVYDARGAYRKRGVEAGNVIPL
jgi:UDP-N-acetyl-D-glucosamine dehydrogenase